MGRRRRLAGQVAVRYRIAFAAAASLLSGCFSYIPAELDTVSVGESVRVSLTRAAIAALPVEVPTQDEVRLRGTLVGREADRLRLRVPVARQQDGFHSVDIEQELQIDTYEIMMIERRQFNRGGTVLLTAGAAALAMTVVLAIIGGSIGGDTTDPPDVPEFRGIPILSFPIR